MTRPICIAGVKSPECGLGDSRETCRFSPLGLPQDNIGTIVAAVDTNQCSTGSDEAEHTLKESRTIAMRCDRSKLLRWSMAGLSGCGYGSGARYDSRSGLSAAFQLICIYKANGEAAKAGQLSQRLTSIVQQKAQTNELPQAPRH